MLTLRTKLRVDGITGQQIFDFLANPNDQAYQQWWPGTHLQLHPLKRTDDHVGDLIYMDEYIGERRLRITGVVVEAVPERRLVWQLRKVTKLPVRLSLDLTDDESGVAITHTIEAGFKGPGRLLGPADQAVLLEEARRGDGRTRQDRVPLAAGPRAGPPRVRPLGLP